MKVLLWHVHGSWTTSFVQGRHDYVLPVLPDRGPDGLGRARTWDWPASVREVAPADLPGEDVDVVVLQRPHDLALAEEWLGRRLGGGGVPAVFVEHNTPLGDVPATRHPVADRDDVPVAHVTEANRLLWDTGRAPTTVVEHAVVDPGHRWTGELDRAAVLVNDPVTRGRTVGADLLPPLAGAVGLDVFGMRVERLLDEPWAPGSGLAVHEDLPQHRVHAELARRGVYVHTARWTSLGLSLVEALHLGVPVVALGATEVPRVLGGEPGAGVVAWSADELVDAARWLLEDRAAAARLGAGGRALALRRFGLDRFLADWDAVLRDVVGGRAPAPVRPGLQGVPAWA